MVNLEDIEIIYKERIEMSFFVYFLRVDNAFIETYLNFNSQDKKGFENEQNSSSIFNDASSFSLFN